MGVFFRCVLYARPISEIFVRSIWGSKIVCPYHTKTDKKYHRQFTGNFTENFTGNFADKFTDKFTDKISDEFFDEIIDDIFAEIIGGEFVIAAATQQHDLQNQKTKKYH